MFLKIPMPLTYQGHLIFQEDTRKEALSEHVETDLPISIVVQRNLNRYFLLRTLTN